VVTQIAYDLVATIVFVALFYVELVFEIPLVFGAAKAMSSKVGTQAVCVALIFQFAAAAILVLIRKPVLDQIVARFPPSSAEVLSEPKFLHKRASDSPETAMLLIEQEQLNLLQRLPSYIEFARQKGDFPGAHHPEAYHQAFTQISGQIGQTLSRISGHGLNHVQSDRLILTTKLEEQLVVLEGVVHRLTTQMLGQESDTRAYELGRNIMESVDFMIMTTIDALKSHDEEEIDMLEMLTQDRSDMMVRIRHSYFESEQDLSEHERNFVLDITILLENAVNSLSRYGKLLRAS
jgi:phosphate:Na+ symporter